MFVQKQFQVEIESTKQLPRAKTNTPIDYSILNMKFLKLQICPRITNKTFQELQIWNFKNYNFVILRITNIKF